jgi:hypothetical protein
MRCKSNEGPRRWQIAGRNVEDFDFSRDGFLILTIHTPNDKEVEVRAFPLPSPQFLLGRSNEI